MYVLTPNTEEEEEEEEEVSRADDFYFENQARGHPTLTYDVVTCNNIHTHTDAHTAAHTAVVMYMYWGTDFLRNLD